MIIQCSLNDKGPELVVFRHGQSAAFMAASVGRLTGRRGVCLVISGRGTGTPAPRPGARSPYALEQTHQTLDSVSIMRPVTQYRVEINSANSTGETVANALRAAMIPRQGAAFLAFLRTLRRS